MSRRKREAVAAAGVAAEGKQPGTESGWKKFASARHIWSAAVVLLVVLGVAGAVSEKYKHSFLSGNESLSNAAAQPQPPIQTGTPQLSKEYIYAGGRMLAVEDANAQLNAPNSISGKVIDGITPENQPAGIVSGMYMKFNGQEWFVDSAYQFSNLIQNDTYTIIPEKRRYSQVSSDIISPFDATLVLREVASGTGVLTPNQRIAADTSGDGNISPFDATLILRYVAANGTTEQGDIGKWKFSPASRTYSPFSSTLTGENYDAMVVGDVNGTWQPPRSTAAATVGTVTYNIQIYPPYNTTAAKGDTVLIPVYFANTGNQAIGSYSFQFKFDSTMMEPDYSAPINVTGTLSAGCQIGRNTASVGIVGISAYCPTAISAGSGTLLYLRFNVRDEDEMPGETLLYFNYSNDGTNPLFEDSQGNRIRCMPSSGYLTLEVLESEEAAASDSLSNQKIEDSQATVAGKAEAFVQPAGQQQQQQQQPATEEMQISLPQNAAATPGGTLSIPVTLTNGAGGKLSGFSFDVQFNPALVQPAGDAIETTGTLSSKCEVVTRIVTPGRIKIVGACDSEITASAGTLVKLRFTVTGQANNASAEARALKLRQIPVFENHKGNRIRVGRTNGSIR